MVRPTIERRLFARLRVFLVTAGASPRSWVAGTVIGSLILAALDILGVAAMAPLMQLLSGDDSGWFIDKIEAVVGTSELSVLVPVTAAFIAIVFIVKSLGSLAFRWWLLGRTTRVSAIAASELARRYVLAPFSQHRVRARSTMFRNVNEATRQSASVLMGVVSLFSDAVVLVAIATVLALASLAATVYSVVLFGLLIFGVQRALRGRQQKLGEEVAEASLESWQFLLPGFDGFREARLTSSAGTFMDGYRRARLRSARAERVMGILSDAPRYLLEIGFVVAIFGISVIAFSTGTTFEAIAVLGVFAAASVRTLPAMNRVTANLATIRTGSVGLRIMVDELEGLERDGSHAEQRRSSRGFDGEISLDGLRFAYSDTDEEVLKGITLRIAEKRTTAVVGLSGAGKSTLLDIILGLLTPTAGSVEVGGRPIHDDLAAWFDELGVVPQDVFLTNDRLIANIAFGVADGEIDRARVTEVLRMAKLEGLVQSLPEGVDTVVGERGVRLSGGQRQRIGLARALYRNPKVLVLDEATSALDNETEHEIAQTLRKLQGTLTIVVVAHRLSTVRHADTLVFLSDGTVEAEGTFDEVRERSPAFARLVQLGELD